LEARLTNLLCKKKSIVAKSGEMKADLSANLAESSKESYG
jgi:hypothetical protein